MAKRPDADLAAESVPTLPEPAIRLDGAEQFPGIRLLGTEPRALVVPAPLLEKIQHYDREAGAAIARRDEMVKLALDLLGVGNLKGGNLDIQTGTVTFPDAE